MANGAIKGAVVALSGLVSSGGGLLAGLAVVGATTPTTASAGISGMDDNRPISTIPTISARELRQAIASNEKAEDAADTPRACRAKADNKKTTGKKLARMLEALTGQDDCTQDMDPASLPQEPVSPVPQQPVAFFPDMSDAQEAVDQMGKASKRGGQTTTAVTIRVGGRLYDYVQVNVVDAEPGTHYVDKNLPPDAAAAFFNVMSINNAVALVKNPKAYQAYTEAKRGRPSIAEAVAIIEKYEGQGTTGKWEDRIRLVTGQPKTSADDAGRSTGSAAR